MKFIINLVICLVLIACFSGCSLEEELLKQLGINEIEASVDMFDGRQRRDPFQIDLITEMIEFSAGEPEALKSSRTVFADFANLHALEAIGPNAKQLREMTSLYDLATAIELNNFQVSGTMRNQGTEPAYFELRISSDGELAAGTANGVQEGSDELFSVIVEPGETLDLSLAKNLPELFIEAFSQWEPNNDPDNSGRYYIYALVYSDQPLSLSASDMSVGGFGFLQYTVNISPGELAQYSNNVKSIAQVSFVGELKNHHDSEQALIVIALNQTEAEDFEPAIFEDQTSWVLEIVLEPGEVINLATATGIYTDYSEQLLEWLAGKLISGRNVQADLGAWSNGEVDITASVALNIVIETKIDY